MKKLNLDKMLRKIDAAATKYRVVTERRAVEETKKGILSDRTHNAYHVAREAYQDAIADLRAAIEQVQS